MRSFWAAPIVAIGGGLILLLAGGSAWVARDEIRQIGDLAVREPVTVPGTEYAPLVVVLGLAGLLLGTVMAVVRGFVHRGVGASVGLAGLAAVAVTVVGITRAAGAEGIVTPAPYAAGAGATALVVAGIMALRGPVRPPVRSRYRVAAEHAEDDEWDTASAEPDVGG